MEEASRQVLEEMKNEQPGSEEDFTERLRDTDRE